MSKAERYLGVLARRLWKRLQSSGSIIEHPDPDLFVGRRYEFITYKILFDLYSLGDVHHGATYETYRGLCFQVWACLKMVHALSAKDTFFMVVPLYEAAESDKFRHLYDIKIEWTMFGAPDDMNMEAFQEGIVAMSAQ
ncbi:unnamed protein product [Clonostachys solani]|uniref:Uncharacterized protein n=1 Tax=Clonostachys solani TaxID=160281 RepID=A0A9N9YUV4_9HYPO|nr:unnamed protein product [Clonostachys solani]